jgi:hypothetical protein
LDDTGCAGINEWRLDTALNEFGGVKAQFGELEILVSNARPEAGEFQNTRRNSI